MRSPSTIISLLLCLCCGAPFVWAQKAEKKDSKNIAAWDRNQDGLLQTDEIPPKLRPQMQAWAAKLELDPAKPLPLDKLIGSKQAATGKKRSGEGKAAKKLERKQMKVDAAEKNNQVELQKPSRRLAGFGNPSNKAVVADDGGEQPDSKELKKDAKATAAKQRQKRYYGMLAGSMLFQNDSNKNGRLERSEWTKLKGNPGASDLDKDGVLTKEELADYLQRFGSRERDVTRRAPSRSSRSTKDKNGKSYRFLTPHERLPKGLPGWFTERDYNVDGQISLFEYEADLTAAKVAKFNQFDLNGDGFIVAQEYLKATQ